jgi:hypothetical protein
MLIGVDQGARLVYSGGVPFIGRATSCMYFGLLLEDWKGCKTKGTISPQEQVVDRHLPDACNNHERRAICP